MIVDRGEWSLKDGKLLVTDSDRQYELTKKDGTWVQKLSRTPLKLTNPVLVKDGIMVIGHW